MPRAIEIPEVLELRDEIARLDHSLVMLLAARQEAVHRLFDVKQSAGRPLFDPAQESLVVSRARRWAREIGAAPADVEPVFRELIQVARKSAGARRRPKEESGVVTVLLAMPSALPKVRVVRSQPPLASVGGPLGLGGHHDDDHLMGPADDHHLGPDRHLPKPTHESDIPL